MRSVEAGFPASCAWGLMAPASGQPFPRFPERYSFNRLCVRQTICHSACTFSSPRRLVRPVTLAEVKADAAFHDFALVRISRLSVMPVTNAQWTQLEEKAGGPAASR